MDLISLHNHTTFCDGTDSMEDFVRYVMEDGAEAIGFSGHSHLAFDESWCMTKALEEAYNAEIDRLRLVYGDRIRIYRGIEADWYGDSDLSGYDYVIGSVHEVLKGGEYLEVDHRKDITAENVEKYYGGDYLQYAADYYRVAAEAAKDPRTDIVGHFDLVAKFNGDGFMFDEGSKAYLDLALGALEEILPYDKIFEMNTGAMSRGYRTTPYVGEGILQYMYAHHVRMTVSADAHHKEDYLFAFPQTLGILRNAGYKEVWEFNGREFVPVGI